MDIIKNISKKFIDIPQNHFVFDIETTGLSPKFCKVILIYHVNPPDLKIHSRPKLFRCYIFHVNLQSAGLQ